MPSTFDVRVLGPGRSTETRTSAWAARWKTASGRTSSKSSSSGSRMSWTWSTALTGHVLALPGRERVDDGDLVAAGDEGIHDVRADEAGAACDDHAHGPHPTDAPRRDGQVVDRSAHSFDAYRARHC